MNELVGGRYVLEQRLGAGGMGEVFQARHAHLGKPFALKILAPHLVADAEARARFQREARLASEITHPNIVSIVDFGEDIERGTFMVMELVAGESLLQTHSAGAMPIARALDILGQVADALDHIHRRGIVHGDVKADNIMIAAEREDGGARRRRVVRLLDFGLAHRLAATEEGVSGSPHYLAPERCVGGPATFATDIYALGVLAYLLFTRTLPFDGELVELMRAHVEHEPQPLASRRGEPLDDAIERLVARAMAKDPTARHPTAAAFRYELNAVQSMLDLGRRRTRRSRALPRIGNVRDAKLRALFERSELAQAIISTDGTIEMANEVFEAFVGKAPLDGQDLTTTILGEVAPQIVPSLRAAHIGGLPTEVRGYVAGDREVVIWIAPTSLVGAQMHVVIWPAARKVG